MSSCLANKMAKFDGVKNYTLLEIERSQNEVTLVFRDNRFMFITSSGDEIKLEDEGVEGAELANVSEEQKRVVLGFKNGKKLVAWVENGEISAESIPE